MSSSDFPNGVATRTAYSGTTAATDKGYLASTTKLISKTAVIRDNTPQDTERQSNFTFPDIAIVYDVLLNVIVADATEQADIGTQGTSNDPNGFMSGVSLANTGLVQGDLADGAITLGALLYEETGTGADVAYARRPCIIAGGDPVSWTCSTGTDTAVFDIIIIYDEVVEDVN
jgi:hypothetical protein